jgi:hypothetical protein
MATSEELITYIQELHKDLEEQHKVDSEVIVEMIKTAQEVYVRQEIAAGLTAAATPGWDYLKKWNDKEGSREREEQLDDEDYEMDRQVAATLQHPWGFISWYMVNGNEGETDGKE